MDASRHDRGDLEFRLEEPDRRTKIGRILMVLIVVFVSVFAWFTSAN